MSLDEKHIPQDFTVDEQIAAAIRAHLRDGKLPCAQAFVVARQLGVAPLTVGLTADVLQIHLSRCQLGLFGYGGKKGWESGKTRFDTCEIPEGMEEAIRAAVDEDGNFACAKAWEIAAQFKKPKMYVGYLADKLGVRIAPCQLGAF